MVRDLTEGKPLKLILAFCVPMIIGGFFQQMYNMVDSVVVGQFVGKHALAAVGSTGSFNYLVLGFVTGMCSGLCIPVSQYFGAGDIRHVRVALMQAIYVALAITAVFTLLMVFFTRPILVLMQTPEDILDLSYDYISIVFTGMIAMVLYNLPAGILRALGDSRTPLIFLIVASLLNVVLDLVFVVTMEMSVAGAAWATVVSQAVSGLLCIVYMRRHFPILRAQRADMAFHPAIARQGIFIGLPMGLQCSFTAVGSILVQSGINSLGADIVAAITAASRVHSIFVQPIETVGITMATYSAQNLGAKKYDRIRIGVRQSLIANGIFSVIACLIAIFAGQKIALLFIKPEEVALLANAGQFLTINALFYPLLAVLLILRNTLQGLGHSAAAMNAGIFELVARALVALGLVSTFGFDAVCFANPVAWLFALFLLVPLYLHTAHKFPRHKEEVHP